MIRLTRNQVRLIDKLAIEKYHMPGGILMENAARATADLAVEMLGGKTSCQIAMICGGGNNGGDGLAAARHLYNCGMDVRIYLATDPSKYAHEALMNWQIVQAMKLPIESWDKLRDFRPRLILDAIFGTGLTQPPRDPFPEIVAAVNALRIPILAVDIPSGLDCDTGKPLGPACVKATRTITFVAEKIGFEFGREFTGEVTVGDIGCPRELIDEVRHL